MLLLEISRGNKNNIFEKFGSRRIFSHLDSMQNNVLGSLSIGLNIRNFRLFSIYKQIRILAFFQKFLHIFFRNLDIGPQMRYGVESRCKSVLRTLKFLLNKFMSLYDAPGPTWGSYI